MLFGWVLTPDEMALLTIVTSILLALLLALFLRCWVKSAQACVLGLGLAPLAIYFVIFSFVYFFRVKPYPAQLKLPLWEEFSVIATFIAPNYPLSFLISIPLIVVNVVASNFFKEMKWARFAVCALLLVLHTLGAFWSYFFLTHKGSL
jgi:hypothetical protein